MTCGAHNAQHGTAQQVVVVVGGPSANHGLSFFCSGGSRWGFHRRALRRSTGRMHPSIHPSVRPSVHANRPALPPPARPPRPTLAMLHMMAASSVSMDVGPR